MPRYARLHSDPIRSILPIQCKVEFRLVLLLPGWGISVLVDKAITNVP